MAPLTGIRVLDLTRLLPGPYATRMLAELGADVIKVEDPRGGDYARWMPPLEEGTSGIFNELNRGKRGVALDLKDRAAQDVLRVLINRCDVLVESFRPGVLERANLAPSDLMRANPKLIYCAMTGFGLTGPDALRAAHDIGYLARSGGLGVSGTPEIPTLAGFQVADIGGALVAVSGILAALYERERTGQGKVVDVSLTEAAHAFNAAGFGMMRAGETPKRGEALLDGSRPCYAIYRTKDARHLAVGALEPKFWVAFLSAIGLPELEGNGLDTGESATRVRAQVQARLLEKTRDEWTKIFRTVEACVEPVLDLDETTDDAHLKARQTVDAQGMHQSPIRLSDHWDTRATRETNLLSPAPKLGEHTEPVLREAGITEDIIRALKC